MRGIDIKDAQTFFDMMISMTHTSSVDLSTFVETCLQMKGYATSIDLHTLRYELKVLFQQQVLFIGHLR